MGETISAERIDFDSLPEYIEYSKTVQHRHSRAVNRLLDLVNDYLGYAEEQARAGRGAAYHGAVWDAPLFYGSDTIPVSITELGRRGSKQAIPTAEAHFMAPREACPMVNSMLGEWYLRRNGPIKRVVQDVGVCEAMFEAAELIRKEGFEVHFIDNLYIAKNMTEAIFEEKLKFYQNELYLLSKFLLNGKKPNEEKIAFELRRYNRLAEAIRNIFELRIQKPRYMKSLATQYLLTGIGHYYGNPELYEDILDELEAELRGDNPEFENDLNVIPLVWLGGRGQEYGIYHAVDSNNGAILGWMSANNFTKKFDENLPPFESMARFAYSNTNSNSMSAELKNASLKREVERVGAKGVLLYGYVGCNVMGMTREIQREFLKKEGVPSLFVDGTFQAGKPTGQLLTRVGAFVEMLS